tara:strand:- start:189 stop:623 length:435 start_codon:yes stop_codon:yes gene_type:complete
MTDNLLLQHILYKSKYSNLKEFSRACQEYLLQNRVPNWTNEQSLYVRLRDNLIGDSQTIFNKKKDERRNKYLIKAIGELLFLHPSDVVYLANKKIDKVKQINDLQDQINVSKRQFQECNSDEYNRKIHCLFKIIQNLNQIINLK